MDIGIVSERLNRPSTGVGVYTHNLIKYISEIHPKNDIYLIDYNSHKEFGELKNILLASSIKSLPMKSYLWHAYLQLALKKKHIQLDLIHSPENATLVIKPTNIKKIITIHDLRQQVFPRFNFETLQSYIFTPHALKTADGIIADSNNTKKDIITYFNISKEKIKVIPLGATEAFKPLKEDVINEFRQKHQLEYPFILYIGNLSQHKNISRLIKSYHILRKKKISHKLILSGIHRHKSREVFDLIKEFNLQDDVKFTGYISNKDLPLLYNSADLFVYPSIYEGFGLPLLEAMACGTPVIASNTSSLPEVVGDAGIMVDPYRLDMLSEAMYQVLINDGLKEDMIKKSLARAKLFSWEKCAKETLALYEKVYAV